MTKDSKGSDSRCDYHLFEVFRVGLGQPDRWPSQNLTAFEISRMCEGRYKDDIVCYLDLVS